MPNESRKSLLSSQDDIIEENTSRDIATDYGSPKKIDRRMLKVLFGICYVNLASNACFSVLASFFDKVSEEHGLSKSEVGFIFGIFAGINVVMSPIFGYLAPILGINFLCISGMVIAGVSAILFSTVHLLASRNMYIGFCIAIRAVQAIGCSMYFTTALPILSTVWGQRLNLAMGVYEISTGIGMIVGPLLGGLLYTVGGFALPFYVVGAMMLFGAFINYFLLPTLDADEIESGSLLDVFKSPGCLITSVIQLVTWSAMDFNIPFLEPLVQTKDIHRPSEVVVGFLFMFMALSYMVTSPIAGIISDKLDTKCTMVVGNILISISYLLLGPAKAFNLDQKSTATVIVSMVLLGIGLSASIVPSMADLMFEAKRSGMPDNLGTESVVGGYFNAIVFTGEFLGPVIGGALIDKHDSVVTATSLFGFSCLILTFACMILYIILHFTRRFPCAGYEKDRKRSTTERASVQTQDSSMLVRSGAFGPRQYSLSVSLVKN